MDINIKLTKWDENDIFINVLKFKKYKYQFLLIKR